MFSTQISRVGAFVGAHAEPTPRAQRHPVDDAENGAGDKRGVTGAKRPGVDTVGDDSGKAPFDPSIECRHLGAGVWTQEPVLVQRRDLGALAIERGADESAQDV